jgi:hypothetical protein
VGARVRRRVEGTAEEGSGFGDVDQPSMDTASPIAVGGACLAGMAGAGYEYGRTTACVTRAQVADRQDRATSGPVGSDWVWEGVRGSEAAAAMGPDRRGRPAQCGPVRF